uniref:Uncharacterized protein n=1 Tax=Anguilla anguilla TaxID=7936 RepID=A0A0E9U3H4_ANGAN
MCIQAGLPGQTGFVWHLLNRFLKCQ